MKQIILTVVLILALTVVMVGCKSSQNPEIPPEPEVSATPEEPETPAEAENPDGDLEEITLTLEELEEYDGTGGKPAYIAIEGIIYDVTDNPDWEGGTHNGYTAGQELTTDMRDKSPHGFSKLEGLIRVGQLA